MSLRVNAYDIIAIWLIGGACECILSNWRGAPAPPATVALDAIILVVLAGMSFHARRAR